ncbi:MAG: globin family protein [Cyanobacteria bacterium P01_F01_bin.42]
MGLQIELLESSFVLLHEHEMEFTSNFYRLLFNDFPAVKPLFKTTDMKEQAKKLFASISLVVKSLKNPEALMGPLKALAQRHVDYGALPEHYPLVGQTLLKAMALTLKEEWNSDFEAAWAEAYGVITEIMLEDLYADKSIDQGEKEPKVFVKSVLEPQPLSWVS